MVPIAEIQNYFDGLPQRVFTGSQLLSILHEKRAEWKISKRVNPLTILERLVEEKKLLQIKLRSPGYTDLVRYTWGNISPLLVSLSIRPNSFLSHGSAMWVHGIGGKADEIFVNKEQSEKYAEDIELTQRSIDRAFRGKQRKSKLIYKFANATVTVLSGKSSGNLAVDEMMSPAGDRVAVTSLERTLVDIVVRPAYAGGPSQILAAFRSARHKVSVKQLLHILRRLGHAYPYHQSIGFYLQRAGYAETDQELMAREGKLFNFYLDYGISGPAFDEDYKIYYPKLLS